MLAPAIGAFALVTAALSATAIASLLTGEFGFSWALGHRSADLLADRPAPAAIAEAIRLDKAALRQSPYDNTARLRLVRTEMSPTGQFGPLGAARIGESYDLMPVDYPVASWRIQVALEHWSEMSPETQAAVRREVLTFSRLSTQNVDIPKTLNSVKSPAGAVAATEMLKEISN
jgi:hypothetical protein